MFGEIILWLQGVEMNLLYWLQSFRIPALDKVMTFVFNTVVGSKGEIWVILGILLLIIPKTRRTGLSLLSAYLIAYFIGDGVLKNLIARPRPCAVDTAVELLVSRPTSFSCPSVHSMLAFSSATAIYCHHRRAGIPALVFAVLIGFSRLYFFVHFPTDVLLGTVLGVIIGILVYQANKSVINDTRRKPS